MFDVNCGWLSYTPFKHYKLPELVRVGNETALFARKEDHRSGSGFTRPLYRLRWPGVCEFADMRGIPASVLSWWPAYEETEDHVEIGGSWSLRTVLDKGWLPPDEDIPEALAYHLAVNHRELFPDKGVQYSVAGLPNERVQEVLDGEFALDAHALSALKYLKWLAETHRPHPLLEGFDTKIREELLGLAQEAARLFFWLLYDYRYDVKAKWWDRGDRDNYRLALYFHWVGRTGTGLRLKHSNIGGACPIEGSLLDNLTAWAQRRFKVNYACVGGKDPCVEPQTPACPVEQLISNESYTEDPLVPDDE